MTQRRNFNRPAQHRTRRGPARQLIVEQRFLLPTQLAMSICYMLYGQVTMQEAKELRLPVPIPIVVPVRR